MALGKSWLSRWKRAMYALPLPFAVVCFVYWRGGWIPGINAKLAYMSGVADPSSSFPANLPANASCKGRAALSHIKDMTDGIRGRQMEEGSEWNEEEVVELIRSLVHPSPCRRNTSRHRYDVCMVSLIRNEYYIKEFLVRNILAGFQKIYLYDNSWHERDSNISNLVRPFVRAGVVDYASALLETGGPDKGRITCNDQEGFLNKKATEHGQNCVWVIRMDADEIVYPTNYPKERIPEFLAGKETNHCVVNMTWIYTYSEGVTRRKGRTMGETLMESYPRMCGQNGYYGKLFVQLDKVPQLAFSQHVQIYGHWKCHPTFTQFEFEPLKNPLAPALPELMLVHYYVRSVEDYVMKKEHSFAPQYREFAAAYGDDKKKCRLGRQPIPYGKRYVDDVRRIMAVQFTKDPVEDRGGKVFEQPTMTREEAGPVSDYDLYLFITDRLREGKWFNQSCYYEKYPDVLDSVRRGRYNDATYYFFVRGFNQSRLECWQHGEEKIMYG